jgi:uncharacterized protein (DUF433 family)
MNTPLTFLNGRITIDPGVCNGKPTLRGKRITVQTILEFLSAGDSEEEILAQYPVWSWKIFVPACDLPVA